MTHYRFCFRCKENVAEKDWRFHTSDGPNVYEDLGEVLVSLDEAVAETDELRYKHRAQLDYLIQLLADQRRILTEVRILVPNPDLKAPPFDLYKEGYDPHAGRPKVPPKGGL